MVFSHDITSTEFDAWYADHEIVEIGFGAKQVEGGWLPALVRDHPEPRNRVSTLGYVKPMDQEEALVIAFCAARKEAEHCEGDYVVHFERYDTIR